MAEHKNKKSILLVEDESCSREILLRALESWGYLVWVASDGEEALVAFKLKSPSVVIADVAMRKLDGLGLLRRLKEADPRTAVILCTARADLRMAISAIRGGATDFLPKPIDLARLKVLLADLFGEDGNSNGEPPHSLSTPANSGPRPPESDLTLRGTRPQVCLPQCRDRFFPKRRPALCSRLSLSGAQAFDKLGLRLSHEPLRAHTLNQSPPR